MRTQKMQPNERAWHAEIYEQIHTKEYPHTQTITVLFSHQLGAAWALQTCADLCRHETRWTCDRLWFFVYISKIIQRANQLLDKYMIYIYICAGCINLNKIFGWVWRRGVPKVPTHVTDLRALPGRWQRIVLHQYVHRDIAFTSVYFCVLFLCGWS